MTDGNESTATETGRNVLKRADARRVEDAVLERRSRIVTGELTMRKAADEIADELGIQVTPANVRSAGVAVNVAFPGRPPSASPSAEDRIGELEDLLTVLGLRLDNAIKRGADKVQRLEAVELEVRRISLRLDELRAAARVDPELFAEAAAQVADTRPEPVAGSESGGEDATA